MARRRYGRRGRRSKGIPVLSLAIVLGQAVPREWLGEGLRCGIERTSTHFGQTSVVFTGGKDQITAQLEGPTRNPPTSASAGLKRMQVPTRARK